MRALLYLSKGGTEIACFGPIGLVIGVILGIALAKQTKCD